MAPFDVISKINYQEFDNALDKLFFYKIII